MEAQIKDIMTKTLIAVPIGSPVAVAANIMKQNKIRHLPIVDEMDVIIGIISKRDFTLLENLEDIPVERVMSAPIYYIDQDTPLRSAIFKMLEHKISSLLISDENDEAIGIITSDDLLGYLVQILDKINKEKAPFFSVLDTQTLGEVARQLSLAGI